ncbi:dipeptidase PepV [Marvinbryantia formatexigens DSM 14469]|uniref:Dipeptidase PepV n=1 Tax=Marvinbryantia formatexigens DSM 14469 TaxID=478749 RepID=C6LEI5_9FIRM|nr:Sapep family Mn(2+)-dependent dipeptidase [Marvinbryantia formatexigens]EET60968.1 dipeptidase PepV [Marvinbryantia formatexigens DSM 14469]UWO24744.1 Sapep family Mn(2+)-dependent dipeptidase [Marvinbryantia formatexigens DSM 14469]SDF21552.1 succinyl-diaminopimelate desuccinylase [Marvinbryantia formatexigens]
MQKQIEAFIDSHKEEMLEDLKTLVRINSVRGEEKPGKPYGDGPAEVLAAAQKMMAGYGFAVKNYDNYVVTGDFNDREKQLDILAHLDVVPVTEDWTVTQPFEPVVIDGKIYGRGTADDKGPAIAALYAMRAIRECGVPLSRNVRLILGSDEECGSSDLDHYYGIEQEAPMSFTPDADFPVINIEKGRLAKSFTASFAHDGEEGGRVLAFHGGDKVNVVPANAWALVTGVPLETVQTAVAGDESGVRFTVSEEESGIRITAKGLAGHASTPEVGRNAICALLALLAELPLVDNAQNNALKAVSELFPFGDLCGTALGVEMEDEISGKITVNLGVLDFDGTSLKGIFDSRVPICGNDSNVTAVIAAKMQEKGLSLEEGPMTPPHHVPAESAFVQTLLASYEKYSGKKGEARAIGGGTYVHDLERGVAFGCMSDDVDNHMHGDDEFMLVDVLVMSAKIFADVICKLCS